ncbi:YceI family protein [Sphingomonas sp. KC8]|nr:YceI family protein [Sphingomonas sp. KC8]ARS27091.1 hypothetical protein KC8_07280 [Sphingomonas sp. KC8]
MGPARYSHAAIVLHWALAAILAFQIALGWQLETLTLTTGKFAAFQLHKSIGITILLLSIARLAIRWWKPHPAPHADHPWAKRMAGIVHHGLYIFMIGGPITGWLLVSTSRIPVPTMLYGALPWPHIPGFDGAIRGSAHEAAEAAHSALTWIGIALVLLHVAGALRHQWLLRQPLIERMLPAAPIRLSPGGSALAYGLALALIGTAFVYGGKMRFYGDPAAKAAPAGAAVMPPPPTPPKPAEPAANDAVKASSDASLVVTEPEQSSPAKWTIVPGGHLGFTAMFTGSPVVGRFTRWDGTIRFDPDALDKTDIRITIDMASAATADAMRDETLRGEAFLATASHAAATFRSTSVKPRGSDRYRATGILTLKGIDQPLALDFNLTIKGKRAEVNGHTAIDRSAFGVGTGEWADTDRIAGHVAIDFRFAATRQD